MSKKKSVFFSLSLWVAGLVACSSLPSNLIQPKVNLQQVNVADPSFSEATLIFHFLVENPNPVDLKVDQVNYALALNGKPFTNGVLEKGLEVGAHSQATIPVPVRVRYSDLVESVAGFLQQGTAPYEVKGTVKMGLFSIPFQKSGEVQLNK